MIGFEPTAKQQELFDRTELIGGWLVVYVGESPRALRGSPETWTAPHRSREPARPLPELCQQWKTT